MRAGDGEVREAPIQEEETTEASFFDDLARGLARGTLSRGRALKLVGASLVSTLLLPLVPSVAAAAPTCPSSGPGCTARCRHTGGRKCVCVELANGNTRCVIPFCSRFLCDRNANCPSGYVCSTTARRCCGAPAPVCVPKCTSTSGFAGAATQPDENNGEWNFNAS